MDKLKKKALSLGASDLKKSNIKNKRLTVIYKNKIINFGSSVGKTYHDHKDEKKRQAWRARHSKIKLKDGSPAYKNKMSPAFWSWHLLWA